MSALEEHLKRSRHSALLSAMKTFSWLRSVLILTLLAAISARADYFVYFGTYTGAKSKGIYVSRMNDEGKLAAPELAAETVNPTYLALHSNAKFLYAIGE